VMIAKYDASGNILWVKRAAGPGRDISHAIWLFNNSVYFTGSLGSFAYAPSAAVTIGSITVAPPPGSTDAMFLAQFDLNGNVLSGVALASGGYNHSSISSDNNCHLYLGGNYHNTNQQSMSIGTNTLNYSVTTNVFLARLDVSCETAGVAEIFAHSGSIVIYPNPCSGSFKIDIDKNFNAPAIVIYDLPGKPLFSQNLEAGKNDILLSEIKEGMYLYVLFENGIARGSGKLILKQ